MATFDPVDKWLTETIPNPDQTQKRQHNREVFEGFLAFTGKTAQQIIQEKDSLSEKQFKTTYEQLLLSYTKSLQKTLQAHEVKGRVDVVRSFFSFYKLPLVFGFKAHVQFFFK